MISCPQCGKQNPENFNYCLDCGSELHPDVPHSAESQFFIDLSARATSSIPGAAASAVPHPAQSAVPFVPPTLPARTTPIGNAPLELSLDDLFDEEDAAPTEPAASAETEEEVPILAVAEEMPEPARPPAEPAAVEAFVLADPILEEEPTAPVAAPNLDIELLDDAVPSLADILPAAPEAAPTPAPAVAAEPFAFEAPVLEPDDETDVPELLPLEDEAPAPEALPPEELDVLPLEEEFIERAPALDALIEESLPEIPLEEEPAEPELPPLAMMGTTPGVAANARARLAVLDSLGRSVQTLDITGETSLGRMAGSLRLEDEAASPVHGFIRPRGDGFIYEDHDSYNGSYVKVRGEQLLSSGSLIRAGRQLLRLVLAADFPGSGEAGDAAPFGSPAEGIWGVLVVITAQGQELDRLPLTAPEVTLGRERGDLLFAHDERLSSPHAKLAWRHGAAYLSDLRSSNGTFIRVTQHELADHDLLLIGQSRVRFECADASQG